jgi:hypothetical protein
VHQRRREVEAALHPTGVALEDAVGRVLQVDELEERLGARARGLLVHAEEAAVEDEQLASRLARVEAGLLERDAHAAAGSVGSLNHVGAGHLGPAAGDGEERGEHAHRGGLACSVRAEEAEDLSPADVQVDAANGLDGPLAPVVVLHKALGENRRAPRLVHMPPVGVIWADVI